jgi:hypothetical protein
MLAQQGKGVVVARLEQTPAIGSDLGCSRVV